MLLNLLSVWTTVSVKKKAAIKAAPTSAQGAKVAQPSTAKPGPYTFPRTEREVFIEFEKLLRLPLPSHLSLQEM
jgi:hypothetical protein